MAISAALPVVDVTADPAPRWALPVTVVSSGGKPVSNGTGGARVPVVVVASGGVPVVNIGTPFA